MAKKEQPKKQKPKQKEATGFGDKKLEGPDRPSTIE
ncbi:spore protein [Bhargavaea massiliensis]